MPGANRATKARLSAHAGAAVVMARRWYASELVQCACNAPPPLCRGTPSPSSPPALFKPTSESRLSGRIVPVSPPSFPLKLAVALGPLLGRCARKSVAPPEPPRPGRSMPPGAEPLGGPRPPLRGVPVGPKTPGAESLGNCRGISRLTASLASHERLGSARNDSGTAVEAPLVRGTNAP